MSNTAKSRIMLWIFILGLCFLSFMAGRAKADTYQAQGEIGFTFDLPHGAQFFMGEEFDNLAVNYGGGLLGGALYVADNAFNGILEVGTQILAYPAGFTPDPEVYWNDQWPYAVWDYGGENVDLAHPVATQQTTLTLTTPEPGSGIFTIFGMTMIGLLGMLGWAKRLERLRG